MNMKSWKNINLHGTARVRKVVGLFDVLETQKVPYGKFKVKVLEDPNGGFIAFTNIAFKGSVGEPEWTSGIGGSVEVALEDAIKNFMETLPQPSECKESSFEWSAPEDF